MLIDDRPREECGVIGIFAPNEDVARMAFFGLYALQHRGQEAAGLAVSDGRSMRLHKDNGLVSRVWLRCVGITRLGTRVIPPPVQARRKTRSPL
jgi:glutamine phosphoribosylpyrophosphate amidotransferase